jgi:hypothetical protein
MDWMRERLSWDIGKTIVQEKRGGEKDIDDVIKKEQSPRKENIRGKKSINGSAGGDKEW